MKLYVVICFDLAGKYRYISNVFSKKEDAENQIELSNNWADKNSEDEHFELEECELDRWST